MKKQTIMIIILLSVGTLFGVGYSASTIISDSGITTSNLTVTGTCTGCGGSGTFTTYSTILNTTITGTSGSSNVGLFTSNDGSILAQDSTSKISLTLLNGTVVSVTNDPSGSTNIGQQAIAQSSDGKYKTILKSDSILVYKNNVLLQTIGIKKSDFVFSDLTTVSVSISPDAHYISIAGRDTGGAIDRIVIFQGS